MYEIDKDGKYEAIWFNVPGGNKCWFGGIPSIDRKCCYCGYKHEDHVRETKMEVRKGDRQKDH